MKKIIILSVLIALSATVVAQNDTVTGYKSIFGDESTVWNGATEYMDAWWDNHVLRASYDTIIDSRNYRKIDCYYLDRTTSNEDLETNIFLREDTLAGKVWCRFPEWVVAEGYSDTIEVLIMDLNLEMGDSIELRHCLSYLIRKKYYVDTIFYIDSLKHIILVDELDYTGKDNNSVSFIEGVGCSNIFGLVILGQAFNTLTCCHRDGVLIYHNPDPTLHLNSDECIIPFPVGIIENDSSLKTAIYPNPCTDWIRIDGENIDRATLLDIKGKIVMPNITLNEPVNLVNIPSGIYFLRVAHKDNISTKTIIKK